MQFGPLPSRLVASVIASCLLVIIYLMVVSPNFALGAEIRPEEIAGDFDVPFQQEQPSSGLYQPTFSSFDNDELGARAASNVASLENNVPQNWALEPGRTNVFVINANSLATTRERRSEFGDEQDPVALESRQTATKTVCISANTCRQPQNESPNQTSLFAPQLTLYVSTSSGNTSPGPDANSGEQEYQVFEEGAATFNATASSNIYLAVSAPSVSSEFTGAYTYEIAASTDGCYHLFEDTFMGNLTRLQTGSSAALLAADSTEMTTDLSTTPLVMFAHSRTTDWKIQGITHSYCGLRNYAEVTAATRSSLTTMSISKRDADVNTQQEFYFSGLSQSSFYWGILASNTSLSGNGGKGGIVFRATNFTTEANSTCELVFNLTLCNETTYQVPGNPNMFSSSDDLRAFYDNYTTAMYANFEKGLAQVPCEAPSTQKYSLARTCDDCKEAYRLWLCSVAIPRCNDISAGEPWLQNRAFNNTFPNGTKLPDDVIAENNITANLTTRNAYLDAQLQPGPYKELLPCDSTCYNLVQSCPASLGFNCPLPGMIGFNTSYGTIGPDPDNPRCNLVVNDVISMATNVKGPSLLLAGIIGVFALLL